MHRVSPDYAVSGAHMTSVERRRQPSDMQREAVAFDNALARNCCCVTQNGRVRYECDLHRAARDPSFLRRWAEQRERRAELMHQDRHLG